MGRFFWCLLYILFFIYITIFTCPYLPQINKIIEKDKKNRDFIEIRTFAYRLARDCKIQTVEMPRCVSDRLGKVRGININFYQEEKDYEQNHHM